MRFHYLLLFPPNLAYHILSQLDYRKEWGPASIFSKKYKNELQKINSGLLISDKQQKFLKRKLNKYFGFITFNCLRPWYKNLGDLIKDFSDKKIVNRRIANNSNYSLKEVLRILDFFIEIMKGEEKIYLSFWNNKKNLFNKQLYIFSKYSKAIIKNYFSYLKKVNPEIEVPKNYFIFLIKSLYRKGRGLQGACAVGIPTNKKEFGEYTRIILHEITHSFSDPILKKIGFPVKVKPGDNKNHIRKEQFVEYILNNYLQKKYKELAKKYIYNLITEEIKKSLKMP